MKQVSVLVGAGSIGQAIIRRVSAGKHIVLADYSIENAQRAAKTLENAGFECSTIRCDLGSKEDILKLVEFATNKGDVTNVVNAAGVSPSQAPVAEILRVDLYGTSVLLEEFGKVIAEGGSGVIISVLQVEVDAGLAIQNNTQPVVVDNEWWLLLHNEFEHRRISMHDAKLIIKIHLLAYLLQIRS